MYETNRNVIHEVTTDRGHIGPTDGSNVKSNTFQQFLDEGMIACASCFPDGIDGEVKPDPPKHRHRYDENALCTCGIYRPGDEPEPESGDALPKGEPSEHKPVAAPPVVIGTVGATPS